MLSHLGHILTSMLLVFIICIGCQPSENANLEANKQLVRDLFSAIDAQDFEQVAELFSDDAVVYMAGAEEAVTKEVLLQVIPSFYTAFPDYNHVIEEMVAEGDIVAARITYHGTHESDFEGIPATGNTVTYTGMQFFRIVDGVMLESWLIEDNLSFMTQLGMQLVPKIENGIAEVNGTKLFYEVAGSGSAIVLIHGNGGDCRHWDYQFESFAQNYKVIRYDVRGFGKSALPVLDENYSHHDDLKALLQHLGVSKAHICGLSMGCGIAVDFALAYPEMCSSLIAAGPWTFGHNSQAAKEMFSVSGKISSILSEKGRRTACDYWLENPVYTNSFKNRKTVAHMKKVGYDYSFWHFTNKDPNFVVEPSASTQTNKISLPTLIITSENDLEACKEVADIMDQNIKDSKKVIITDAGHCMNMDKPSEFNKIAIDFLREISN